jgi:hypothetical protein
MAIKLIANYSKRLGLPGYSSHQFSVEIETELVATDDVAAEAARIYELLQTNVDEQIQHTGFVPPGDYGMMDQASPSDSTRQTKGTGRAATGSPWKCSEKQKGLIENLVEEHHLDKNAVDHLARQRFGKGVRELNKVEASGLINELIEAHGGQKHPANNSRRSAYAGVNGNNGGGRR